MASVNELRKHVLDDALEMMETVGVVRPLVTANIAAPTRLFLRRVLTRHVVMVLCRLYEKANTTGPRGVTASINGLLDAMGKSTQFASDDIDKLKTRSENLKKTYESACGTFDKLTFFRNTELAHSLQPHNQTTPELQWHPLEEFAQGTFDLVWTIESTLKSAELIERGRSFWECVKDCAQVQPPG